jgi:hypothetical protein
MERSLNCLASAIALATGFSLSIAETPALAQPIPGNVLHLDNARDYKYCEIDLVQRKAFLNAVVNIYNTSDASDCPPDKFDAIHPKQLAAQTGSLDVWLNPRRSWVMDEIWLYDTGETRDFDGVKATWVATRTPEMFEVASAPPYTEGLTCRLSKLLYKNGSTVFLISPPGLPVVYVMQSYTNHIEKGLTLDKLPNLGSMLTLPTDWKFNAKTLDRDLAISPPQPNHCAHLIRDDFFDVYEGCGFDPACNFVP